MNNSNSLNTEKLDDVAPSPDTVADQQSSTNDGTGKAGSHAGSQAAVQQPASDSAEPAQASAAAEASTDSPTHEPAADTAASEADTDAAPEAAAAAVSAVAPADTAGTTNAAETVPADNAAAQAETAPAADAAAQGEGAGENQVFRMGDDVSSITGRPHITAEENRALAQGNRFFHKAMESAARARGEEYERYSLPAHMRAALNQIDMEVAQERLEERRKEMEKQGLSTDDLTVEESAISRLHNLSAEEQEALDKQRDKDAKIEAGGARFYGKYQELLARQKEAQEASKLKVMRNIKLMGVVIVGLIGYMAYNHFMVDRNADTIESLKASLPLVIDEQTTMVRIDDRANNFKIYFEKDPAIVAGLDEHQKEARLDVYEQNALELCKNPLLRSIIVSGRKVTVLLEATDRSFFREYSVDKCPAAEQQAR